MGDHSALVLTERRDGIVCWILNRPDALNAFNRPLLAALRQAIDTAQHDRSIRCAIVSGAGPRAFSAGADLKERQGMSVNETREYVYNIRTTFDAVARLPFPTIAAVNGVAFGGGMELLLACDLRILAEHAEIGLTEVAVGIMPGAGGTQRLPQLVGVARAKELIYTARRLTAFESQQIGLANNVVPADGLTAAADALADRIAMQAPLAVRGAKYAVDAGLRCDVATGLEIEAAAYALLLPTEDRLEGLRAFAEKRKPQYRGE
jgi:enoyl-CoA hydratase/carnithine racemase